MRQTSFIGRLNAQLRFSEKTLLAFFAAVLVASATLSLPGRTFAVLALLNVMLGFVIVTLSKTGPAARSRTAAAIRDWLPAILLLLAYRETGLFIHPDPAHRLDHLFILWDKSVLHSRSVEWLLWSSSPWLQHYLELCYLLCYPLVPLGFAVLYLARPRDAALHESRDKDTVAIPHRQPAWAPETFDRFWTTVLLATLFCYGVYPLFPLTPPRVLFNDVPGPAVTLLLRHMNVWVLDRFSVQACLFPSGHAAAVTATALAVCAHRRRVGILFCITALSVAAATVYGRYHYLADAVAGVLVGIVAFVVSCRIHKHSNKPCV